MSDVPRVQADDIVGWPHLRSRPGSRRLPSFRRSTGAVLDAHGYPVIDTADRRRRQTRSNGAVTTSIDFVHDALGQLIGASAKEPAGSTLRRNEQFGFAYDPAGNHLRRTNDPFVVAFAVDSRNQLASASGNLTVAGSTSGSALNVSVNGAAATLYSDGTFARTNLAPTASLVAIASDAAGRTDTHSLSAWYPGSTTFAHDANGNLISDGRRAFSWDPENRLVEVLVTNAWKTGLLYDGLGRLRVRTETSWNGVVWATNASTRYVYDGWLVIEERDGANNPRLAYTRGRDLSGSRSGAGGIGGLLALTRYDTPSPAHAWYHADGSGNVTALVNAGQYVVARYLYDPYGGLVAQSGGWSDLNRLRFSSKEHLTSSGLYAYGRRFLAPELGLWLDREPWALWSA